MRQNQPPVGEHIRKFGEHLMFGGLGAAVIGKVYEAVANTKINEITHDSIDYFSASGYTMLGGSILAAAGAIIEIVNEARSVRGETH